MNENEVPLFSVRRITKIFANGFTALKDVSLDIYEKQCLILAGSNGSGKTLLMRIITALADADGGEVFFKGQPLNKTLAELRKSAGLVFQDADAQIIGETVAEDISLGPKNLKIPKNEVELRVESTLKAIGLEEKRDFPPRNLSGGEKRRLAVAGILAMGCETIIFDEPFANLDWTGIQQTQKIILDLKNSGKTVIILTHELEKVIDFADRLVILHQGAIKDSGKPPEVLDRLRPEYGVRDPR